MEQFFTTSRGVKVEILSIQTLLEKFEAAERMPRVPEELRAILGTAMPKPDAPTYDVKTITGVIETHLHDETTLTTDAEKAAWEKYRATLAAYQADRTLKRKKLILLHGIRVELPTDETWVKSQEEIGISVPGDPMERKLHYIETEVLGGVGDFLEITKRCSLAGLPEEVLGQAEALFQRQVGRFLGRDTAEATADPREGQVVGQSLL